MSTDYEPGTVAVATVGGVEGIRVSRYDGGWAQLDDPDLFYSDRYSADMVTDIRPLVVLDLSPHPENVTRLLAQAIENDDDLIGLKPMLHQIEAQTKPRRIPEPGWGEKVKARAGDDPKPYEWLRYTTNPNVQCQWVSEFCSPRPWPDLIDPEAVSR